MKYGLFLITILVSHFSWADYVVSDDDFKQIIECKSQKILVIGGQGSVLAISTKTNHQTEVSCWGQCLIPEWACISVDNIPYLLFRGSNDEHYTIGPDYGNVYIGHWAVQLNEIDYGVSIKHKRKAELHNFLKMLDETDEDHLVSGINGLDFKTTVRQSKFFRMANKKYPYVSKVYQSAKFTKFDFQ